MIMMNDDDVKMILLLLCFKIVDLVIEYISSVCFPPTLKITFKIGYSFPSFYHFKIELFNIVI